MFLNSSQSQVVENERRVLTTSQVSIINQFNTEIHLLVSLIVSNGLRGGYMHAYIRGSMGFKIVSRKTAKTLARGTSVSNTSWSSESPRVKPGHMWASSCCFPFLQSADNYIPHLDIHHRCASSFVGGCFHIVFLLSVTLLYFVVSPDNLFFFHFREYFLVFFHVY